MAEMSEDQNSKLMEQFIERAAPKLLDALKDQVSKHIEDQIGGLKSNTEKMLDQLKDAQRAREKQDQDFSQLKTLLERGDAPKTIKDSLNPDPIKLTREQARDPALYRRAKAAAAQNGTTIQIEGR
jgi:hypothetical protein